jgi:hypothetical protein
VNNTTAARLWSCAIRSDSDARRNRWSVAGHAYKTVGKREIGATVRLAEALIQAQGDVPAPDRVATDTVEQMAKAYRLFVMLAHEDCQKAKQYRRKYNYSRFFTVYQGWAQHEFELSQAWDYLDYEGGNRAIAAFIDNNNNPLAEWERNTNSTYKFADKLQNDYEVPQIIKQAAQYFINAVKQWRAK